MFNLDSRYFQTITPSIFFSNYVSIPLVISGSGALHTTDIFSTDPLLSVRVGYPFCLS
jgi:hypothetical protein